MSYRCSGRGALVTALGIYLLWCMAIAYHGGRDLNWDTLNYHLYVPSLLFRPLDQDFLGASMQSYLNPGSLLPFYAMVKAGWPAVSVMSVLAAIHALNLLLLHVITDALLPSKTPWRWALCVAGALLGGSAALFWIEVGTSFNDVICSLPVLAAIACLLRRPQSERSAWTSGGLIGVAVGLKLTALPWIGALGLMCLYAGGSSRWRRMMEFCLGAVVGFLLTDGLWALRLFNEFGNPFFPFFNDIFRSPLSPSEPLVHDRFKQGGVWSILTFPWRVAVFSTQAYTESVAIDLRPAVLMLIGAVLVLKVWRSQNAKPTSLQGHALLCAALGCVAYYVCWILLSGNGRYAIAWLLMLGPLIVACWVRLHRGVRWPAYGLATLMGLQVCSNLVGGAQRWASTPWPEQWFSPKPPMAWSAEPHLFLSLEVQSYSFLSQFVHQDSGFVNLIGQLPIRQGGAEWARVAALLKRHEGHVRTLMPPASVGPWQQPLEADTGRHKALLAPYGLTIDAATCVSVVLDPLSDHPAVLMPAQPWSGLADHGIVVSCSVRPFSEAESLAYRGDAERYRRADKLLDYIERHCPSLTGGRSSVTTFGGYYYSRYYVNTGRQINLRVPDGRLVVRGYDRHAHEIPSSCIDEAGLSDFVEFSEPARAGASRS